MDKGKEKVIETRKKHVGTTVKTSTVGGLIAYARKNVGGFMTDARKNVTKSSTQKSTQSAKKAKIEKKKQYLMPIKRQAASRINKINIQRKTPGPGNSSKDPMDVN